MMALWRDQRNGHLDNRLGQVEALKPEPRPTAPRLAARSADRAPLAATRYESMLLETTSAH